MGRDQFIELNRTFRELDSADDVADDTNWLRASIYEARQLDWNFLLQKHRVIILSEAGAGKTEEMRNMARSLRSRGKPAFFLRLEHVKDGFEYSFEVGEYEEFTKWLTSGEDGWLFWDSVDEARIKSSHEFALAIRKLGHELAPALQVAHVYITSRISAWRHESDLVLCNSKISFKKIDQQLPSEKTELQTASEEAEEAQALFEPFKVVALNDLSSKQVEVLAAACGIASTEKFLEEIDRKDAWLFAKRPQDLKELVDFWLKNGRIGSTLELTKHSIDRRLSERDQDRAEARPIPPSKIREGARLIAAAATLTQNSTIRIPDGENYSEGIAIAEILPDWSEQDQAILLSRPIFDEAMYGTVRFHHRTMREYLTAEWLHSLLNQGGSRKKIEGLLFRKQYGVELVSPTLRPVLPWLALLDSTICDRLCAVAPEVLLEGGDPSQLPLKIRREIFQEVCSQILEGTIKGGIPDTTAVQKFANADIASDVKAKLAAHDDAHIKFFLLRLIWAGSMKEVLSEAKALALSPSTELYARIAAFDAVKSVGSQEDMEDVRASFFNESAPLKRIWLAQLIEGLPSTANNVAWLFDCLKKVENVPRDNSSGLTRSCRHST